MAERTMEQRLAAFGATLTFPRADELVDDVLAALDAEVRPLGSRRRHLLLAAAAVLVVIAALVAAVPGSRHAVARWLGFENLRIEHVERLPEEVAPSVPAAAPAPSRLGPEVSLDDAAATTGVVPRVAEGLGEPLSVHAPGDRYVAVRYGVDGGEVIVATLPGDLEPGLFTKLVDGGVEIVDVEVGGMPAYWITGRQHVLMYVDPAGQVQESRLADDTLVWEQGDVIVRVEGDIPLERAMAIAETVGEP